MLVNVHLMSYMDVRAPDRTIGARNTPFLKSSDVRCPNFDRFWGLGEGEVE